MRTHYGSPDQALTAHATALAGDPYVTGDHNVIELSIPLDLLSGAPTFTVHTTQDCRNDVDKLTVPIPESTTMLMLGGLGAGVAGARKLRKKKPIRAVVTESLKGTEPTSAKPTTLASFLKSTMDKN